MYRAGSWLFRFRYILPALIFTGLALFADPAGHGLIMGAALIFAGEALRLWAARHCGRSSRTLAVPNPAQLVTSGPFARVRNPIYLANILIYLGVSVLFCPDRFWVHFTVFVLMAIQYTIIIAYEEKRLAELFGDQYIEYSKRVRRFLPKMVHATGLRAPFSLKTALRSERGTLWTITLVALAYAALRLLEDAAS